MDRGVPAVFIGHPIFDTVATSPRSNGDVTDSPDNEVIKIALLPDRVRRKSEANWPIMQWCFARLREKYPNLCAQIAAADERTAHLIRSTASKSQSDANPWSDALNIVTAKTDEVLKWADVALVVSGTATLLCAAHTVPMVVMYHVSTAAWWLYGRWIVQTDTFSLPNLIAALPLRDGSYRNWFPNFGDPTPVADAMEHLICDRNAREQQRSDLKQLGHHFTHLSYMDGCTEQLIQAIDGRLNIKKKDARGGRLLS